jgi:hypothetical protein
MRKVQLSLLLIGAAGLSSALVHPLGTRTPTDGTPLFSGARITPEVRSVFQRSCADCHSNETVWPWYSKIAPMSWMIDSDVRRARAKMNLSHWDEYSAIQREAYLNLISILVRKKEMPLPRYTRLHPNARLSDEEIALIRHWTLDERKLLENPAPPALVSQNHMTLTQFIYLLAQYPD